VTDLLALPRAAAATALGVTTAVRGARVFHPRGQTRQCRLAVAGGTSWGARVLDEPAEHDGVVRTSRGIGLPAPLPDVDGLALRLPGLGVDGLPLDVLINSAWRFAFAPSVLSATWSCVLPYRTGSGRQVLLGARPQESGFTMWVAPVLGAWQPWGRLEVGDVALGDVRTDPTVGAEDLVPVEPFRRLRAWSYAASQSAR
jgi:hypothetical protein